MNSINEKTLKIAFHGIDDRIKKIFVMFLEGPCKGAAYVASDPKDANVDFFDSDIPASRALLEAHLENTIQKPVIVQSLLDFQYEGIISLKEPVTVDSMLLALAQAKKLIDSSAFGAIPLALKGVEETLPERNDDDLLLPSKTSKNEVFLEKIDELHNIKPKSLESSESEVTKAASQQTTMQLDEKSCQILFKSIDDIDLNDPSQFENAYYNPSNFYQGTVQSAISISRKKNQSYMLHSIWNRIILLPQTGEIWHDGNEEDIRIFAGIPLKHNQTKKSRLHLTPISPEVAKLEAAKAKGIFQGMDVFLWKLACWTSMGRYPQHIDYTKPVYLLSPPDFNRLLIMPHAQSIAELLSQGPKTMGDIAITLNIKPQFVFLFISALDSIGLVVQKSVLSNRLSETLKFFGYPSKGTEQ